jgi:nucleoside-diphosphate-sugar epimerase
MLYRSGRRYVKVLAVALGIVFGIVLAMVLASAKAPTLQLGYFMKILITGGAGFLGQRLTREFAQAGKLTVNGVERSITAICAFDQGEGVFKHPLVNNVSGDISNASSVAGLVDKDTGLVVHLAAVVSGSAEADFDLGFRVNLDGTRHVLEACRRQSTRPTFLFSSSIAVFGGDLPAVVTDSTTPTPQGSYGIQKLIGEHLVQDYTRKGFIDGRAVRVPTVVVRPGTPNGAASGFASGMIREPLNGIASVLPVPLETEMWEASPRAVVAMLKHAIALDAKTWGWNRVLNLPGLVARMDEAVAALRKIGGEKAASLVSLKPDPAVVALVSTWAARFDTARANSMGFVADSSFEDIVHSYIEENLA